MESSLYKRLGGAFAIAGVVDHFSDAIVQNPIVGQKPKPPTPGVAHEQSGQAPGLKFMRTLWVCTVAGGPQQYAATEHGSTPLGLEEAHRDLKISPPNSTRSLPSLDEPLTISRCQSRRRRGSGRVRRAQGRSD